MAVQQSKSSCSGNLRIVAFLRICFSALFSVGIITLYWKQHGMDILGFFWLQAIFALAVVLFEIPTGYLGDRLGRKRTLILSGTVFVLGWTYYAFCNSFLQFVIAELVLGLAFSLFSGTDTSLVYESLKELKQTKNFTYIEGRQNSIGMLSEAIAVFAGGIIAMFLPIEYTMIASGLMALLGLLAAFSIKEPNRQTSQVKEGIITDIYQISCFVFIKSKMVRYVITVMAVCALSTMLGVWLYQPLWEIKAVPVWLFGLLWAGQTLSSSLTSHLAQKVEKKIGIIKLILLLPALPITGYIIIALSPGLWPLLGPYIVNLSRGFNFPVLGRFIHEETPSAQRATVFSIQNWLFKLSYFIIGPVIGWTGKHLGLPLAFLACATVTIILNAIFLPPLIKKLSDSKVSS